MSDFSLPEPTKSHLVLDFVFSDTDATYRRIRVPSNYSFELIHKLIQYTFGWSDIKPHKFTALGQIKLVSASPEVKHVQNWGSPKIKISASPSSQRSDDDVAEEDEKTFTLGDVWKDHEKVGANEKLGVSYEYDYEEGRMLEIIYKHYQHMGAASNLPHIIKGSGGPPRETIQSHEECDQKTFDVEAFNANWQGYLGGTIQSKAGLKEVALGKVH
ncbi:Protein MM3350-like domain [Phaffia rhodozyma]|uniref:Protein MM3350-like domain n=1 Tax=Phaffia rhodozyma TaxID=264483 RepID=A0A0F7SS78_PHARH|nr:Protein MM3350-like domain [Phaffia rhodozyma]